MVSMLAGLLTLRASSTLPFSARELGDSGRMMPATRMIRPGAAAWTQHPYNTGFIGTTIR